jgi:hypothetical protein
MASAISSDLIVDVMRNADPSRLSAAVTRLDSIASENGPNGFHAVLAGVEESRVHEGHSRREYDFRLSTSSQSSEPIQVKHDVRSEAGIAFEQMVLRNLFESLLPNVDSGVFGTGPSAGVWRSLAADNLGSIYASAGGIGIAATLSGEHAGASGEVESGWPYFAAERIVAFTG